MNFPSMHQVIIPDSRSISKCKISPGAISGNFYPDCILHSNRFFPPIILKAIAAFCWKVYISFLLNYFAIPKQMLWAVVLTIFKPMWLLPVLGILVEVYRAVILFVLRHDNSRTIYLKIVDKIVFIGFKGILLLLAR